jgi:hypothetical protein
VALKVLRKDESGQAVVEYILMLSVVATLYILAKALSESGIAETMMRPLTQDFARAYRYGHVEAQGFEDGGPKNHPRASQDTGEGNFRIFLNPEIN